MAPRSSAFSCLICGQRWCMLWLSEFTFHSNGSMARVGSAGHCSMKGVFGGEMGTEVWDRFTIHHTPTHGSGLNQAEISSASSCASV
jgi:hypothetical protein